MWTVERYVQPPVLNKINLQTTTYSEPLTHIKKKIPKMFFFFFKIAQAPCNKIAQSNETY